MARVIQDSDEESDGDLEGDLPPPKQQDASGQAPSIDTDGTGSTESLKRAIALAHRNHLQSQPSQEEPQSSVSLPEHPNKKRKTAADPSPLKTADDASIKRKVPVTYGKAAKSIFSSSPTFNAPLGDPASPHEVPWLLEGSMRDDYAHHEPTMFPEPSSTVPNATMTQQHVLDIVNAPMMMGQQIESEGPRYIPPPEPSIPWSDLMKFTPAEATDQTESSDRDPPSNDPPSATPIRTTQGGYEYSASQRSRRGSSVRLRGSPLRNELSHTEASAIERKAPPVEAISADIGGPTPTALQTLQTEREEVRMTPRRSKSQRVPVASSDDDLAAIGLPKEQYKPRPSRSRSLKVEEEQPIDYSVRPEKAKKVSKRRQTTAADDVSRVTTPEKVRQICDMGFTPSTTSGALKQNNGDVMQTIDWLVTNNVGHDELAPPSPPTNKSVMNKSNGNPAMDSETIQDIMRNLNSYQRDDVQAAPQDAVHVAVANNTVPSEPKDDVIEAPVADVRSPTKVQVVIPKKSPIAVSKQPPSSVATSNRKAKRRKTTSDQPESEPAETNSAAPEVVPAKKKGRGRPKKVAPIDPPIEPDPEPLGQTADEVVQTIEPASVSEEAQQCSKNAPKKTDDAKSAGDPDATTVSHSNPPSKASPTAASETPERKIKPSTASPLNTGKVPYRVGLSKRARIAPLLRIVKK